MSYAISIYDFLEHSAQHFPDQLALIDDERRFSYSGLLAKVDAIAGGLSQFGIGQGSRVAISIAKSAEEVIGMLATIRQRAIYANISRQWTIAQFLDTVAELDASVLLVDAERAAQLVTMQIPAHVKTIVVTGGIPPVHEKIVSWQAVEAAGAALPLAPHRPLDNDTSTIIFTSGSTGKPKGVMLSNRNLVSSILSTVSYLENHSGDRVLAVLPFCFNYGLGQLLTMLAVGGTTVLQKTLLATELVESLQRHRITGFAGIPPIWNDLIDVLEDEPQVFPALRYITNAGGKCTERVLEALPVQFPYQRIYLMYGMTEAVRSTYLAPEEFTSKRGALGRAVPNAEIFVVNTAGRQCLPDEIGELVHRGPSVAQGYLNAPEATREKFRSLPSLAVAPEERLCFSGDLVRIDEDGVLWYVGRNDRMIKSSGYRISPTEVEDVLLTAPGVLHTIVFGQDDVRLGQKIVAIFTTRDGETLNEASLRHHCRRHLPGYMVPAVFHQLRTDLPFTGNGKIDVPSVIRSYRTEALHENKKISINN